MLPKNFPLRVNARRRSALSRLESYELRTDDYEYQIQVLKERIMDDEEARQVRTKKFRATPARR